MEGADMATGVDSITLLKPYSDAKNEASPMLEAYKLVKDGKSSIRNAARIHRVPEATLRTRLKNPQLFECSLGHPLLLRKSEEDEIAEHLRTMTSLGYGFSRSQALEVAAKVAKVSGSDKSPKKDWYYGFLKRYPDLTTNKMKRNLSKLIDTRKKNLRNYFKEFEAFLEEHDLKDKAEKIWNVEVIGLSLDKSADVGVGRKWFCVDPGMTATASIILAGNAQGEMIPPYVIYKGRRLTKDLITGCITQSQFAMSPSGWPTNQTLEDFLENLFIPHVDVRPNAILYDGNATFITMNMIQTAKEKGIHFFVLPPHLCNQPTLVDSGIFMHFKESLIAKCVKLLEKNGHVRRRNIPHLIAEAFEASVTVVNLTSAFRNSGLVPFNPSTVVKRENHKRMDTHKGVVEKKHGKLKKILPKVSLDLNLGKKLKKRRLQSVKNDNTDGSSMKKRRKDPLQDQFVQAEILHEDAEVLHDKEGQDSEVKNSSITEEDKGRIESEVKNSSDMEEDNVQTESGEKYSSVIEKDNRGTESEVVNGSSEIQSSEDKELLHPLEGKDSEELHPENEQDTEKLSARQLKDPEKEGIDSQLVVDKYEDTG